MIGTQDHRLKLAPIFKPAQMRNPTLTMVRIRFEIDVERYFLYRNHLPCALISLGITAKEKAKKKNNNFIMISLGIF